MKILVLGASGRTGKHILEYALADGYKVHCLVRNSLKVRPAENLQVFEGNPLNIEDLENAAEGCTALISALNISRKTDFPWSKLRTPKDFLSKVITNVILVSAKTRMNRLVLCSAWGVAETRKDIPFWFRCTIDCSNIRHAYLDHEKQEVLIEKSKLDWTIVRPVGLLNSNTVKVVRESFENMPKPKLTIGRKSVAHYMLRCLKDDELIGKRIVIST